MESDNGPAPDNAPAREQSNPIPKRKFRGGKFSLRWMLVAVGLVALLMWLFTQVGMKTAYIKIVDSTLVRDDFGKIRGELSWRLAEAGEDTTVYSYFVCSISNVNNPTLLDLEKGDEMRIRYRTHDVGPFPKEDKYKKFIVERLGIDANDIVGFTMLEDRTNVVITGE